MAATMVRLRRDLSASGKLGMSNSLPKGTGLIVTRDELNRYKDIIAADDIDKTTTEMKTMEKKRMADLARSKREQIAAIDEEKHRNRTEDVDPDFAQLEQARRSKRLQDEDRDQVKGMNTLMLQSRCAHTLGMQVEEKKAIAALRTGIERRKDTEMEVERLKSLKEYEERERKRVEDRRKGALVIKAQLEEREAERLRQLEIKHQEQQMMLRHIEKLKEEERKIAEKKQEDSRRLMLDIALANAEQIRMKARQRDLEVAEDRRIAQYIKEKQKRETELVEEQERSRAEREREVARLRSLQEKAQDLQAEADAVRAKRIQDAFEKEERLKKKKEQERLARMERELAEAREAQKREKEEAMAEQAELEAEDHKYILAMQRLGDAADRRRREEEMQRRVEHQKELKDQIDHMKEQKKLEKRAYYEEGRRLRKEKELHDKHMAYIAGEKIHQLAEEGISPEYHTHLARMRKPEPSRSTKL